MRRPDGSSTGAPNLQFACGMYELDLSKLGRWKMAACGTNNHASASEYYLLALHGHRWRTSRVCTPPACSILAFANPVLAGLINSCMPKSVLAWKTGGGPALWREALGNAVLIAAVMTLFTLATRFAGEWIMHVMYPGAEYQGHGHVLTVLALAIFWEVLARPHRLH